MNDLILIDVALGALIGIVVFAAGVYVYDKFFR